MADKLAVANEIARQLGGTNRLSVMLGAYNFAADEKSLSFRIKNRSVNYIKITLTPMDLYDLEFGLIRGYKYKVLNKVEGIYNDQLRPIIEKNTGMYLPLGTMGRMEKGGTTSDIEIKMVSCGCGGKFEKGGSTESTFIVIKKEDYPNISEEEFNYQIDLAADIYRKQGLMSLRQKFLTMANTDEKSGMADIAKIKRDIVKSYGQFEPKMFKNGGTTEEKFVVYGIKKGEVAEVFGYKPTARAAQMMISKLEKSGKLSDYDIYGYTDTTDYFYSGIFKDGGSAQLPNQMTKEQVEEKLGRKLHWWKDDEIIIDGNLYKKEFLKPIYKLKF